jgi:hypothetical protein
MTYADEVARRQVEQSEEWDKWLRLMPKLTVPDGCQISVVPPLVGAIVRFIIFKGEKSVSVYFDAYSRLGCYDGPYWEAYPIDGDNVRYSPERFDQMMADIAKELA